MLLCSSGARDASRLGHCEKSFCSAAHQQQSKHDSLGQITLFLRTHASRTLPRRCSLAFYAQTMGDEKQTKAPDVIAGNALVFASYLTKCSGRIVRYRENQSTHRNGPSMQRTCRSMQKGTCYRLCTVQKRLPQVPSFLVFVLPSKPKCPTESASPP